MCRVGVGGSRDTVIKNGYSSRKLDELGSIDAIVIGSGEW